VPCRNLEQQQPKSQENAMLLAVAFRALMRALTYVGLTLVFLFLAYAALQLRKATADDDTRAARADQTSMLPGRVVSTVNGVEPPSESDLAIS
jgi:hypothetical protein